LVDAKTTDAKVKRIEKGNSKSFIDFLLWVLCLYTKYRKISLYFDNAKWHKSKEVKKFLAKNKKICLYFFPTYSPELNPTEWEWHELRRLATHTRRFQSDEECWQTIQEHFQTRKGKNKHFLCQIN